VFDRVYLFTELYNTTGRLHSKRVVEVNFRSTNYKPTPLNILEEPRPDLSVSLRGERFTSDYSNLSRILYFVDTVDTSVRTKAFSYVCSVTSQSEARYFYKTRNDRNVEGIDRVPFLCTTSAFVSEKLTGTKN
jgi:hypothetical protein